LGFRYRLCSSLFSLAGLALVLVVESAPLLPFSLARGSQRWRNLPGQKWTDD
jgi:hypothetical protein